MSAERIYEWDFPNSKNLERLRQQVMTLCCEEFGCTIDEIRGKSRNRNLSNARMVFSAICRKQLDDTLMRIGIEINVTHASVIYLLTKMEDYQFVNDKVIGRMKLIERKIFNP